MRRHFRPPSAPTVIASVALLAALGGTSYAAATISSKDIKNNSVRGVDIKNNTVSGKDVKNSSITGVDVKNGSLLAKDFKKGELPTGSTGPGGPPGSAGGGGSNPGTLSYEFSDDVTVGPHEEGNATAFCPEGMLPTGGGGFTTSNPNDPEADPPAPAVAVAINTSYPFVDDSETGWDLYVENDEAVEQTISAYVVCSDAELPAQARLKLRKRRH